MPERLFIFIQMEFPWALGPPDGRYLLRTGADGEAEHVVVLGTLAPAPRAPAPPARPARRPPWPRRRPPRARGRRAPPEPPPGPPARAPGAAPLPPPAGTQPPRCL